MLLKGGQALADFLGVSRAAISVYRKQGLEHIEHNGNVYFNLLKVIDWLRGGGAERRLIADKAEKLLREIEK